MVESPFYFYDRLTGEAINFLPLQLDREKKIMVS